MNSEELKVILYEELLNLAPEMDLTSIDTTEDLREELDIDSMDFLRLTIALSKRLEITIPDAEQAKLVTFDGMLSYLEEHKKDG